VSTNRIPCEGGWQCPHPAVRRSAHPLEGQANFFCGRHSPPDAKPLEPTRPEVQAAPVAR